jgi:hypothetical protein
MLQGVIRLAFVFLMIPAVIRSYHFSQYYSNSICSKFFLSGKSPLCSSKCRGSVNHPAGEPILMSAGAGFGQPKRRLKLAYGGSSQSPIEQQKRWEVAYKAYISRMGKYLTAMSWEGHSQMGRGAIYANIQAREPIKRGERAQTWQKFGGIPTLYVPLEQYQVKSANTEQESKDLQQIIARIENYNAEREFVVVLEAGIDSHALPLRFCSDMGFSQRA